MSTQHDPPEIESAFRHETIGETHVLSVPGYGKERTIKTDDDSIVRDLEEMR